MTRFSSPPHLLTSPPNATKFINIPHQFRYDMNMSQINHSFALHLLTRLAHATPTRHHASTHLSTHHIAIIQFLLQTPLFEHNDFIIKPPAVPIDQPQHIPYINPSNIDSPSWQRPHYDSPIPMAIITLNQLKQTGKNIDYQRHIGTLNRPFPEHLKPALIQHIHQGASLLDLLQVAPDIYSPHEHQVAKIIAHQTLTESHFIRTVLNHLWQLHQCMYYASQPPLTDPTTMIDPRIFSKSGQKKVTALNWHAPVPSSDKQPYYQHQCIDQPSPTPPSLPITLSPSALLTYQECPFRFFSRYILKIPQVQTDESRYFSQLGELIHHIWAQYTHPTHEQIIEAMNHNHYFISFSQHLKQALAAHITQIADEWQILEESRPTFKTIGREKDVSYQHANITIQGRIDRIDQLDEATHLIIDYKSTKPTLNWYQDQLQQLPIYAIMYGKKARGLAYAQLKKNQCLLSGHLSEYAEHAPLTQIDQLPTRYGVDSWQQAWEQWQHQLNTLMQNISLHPLSPQPSGTTCSTCEFKPLCRVHLEPL